MSKVAELFNKASNFVELTKYQEAIELFDEALKIAPHDKIVLQAKSDCLYRLDKYQEALNVLEEVLDKSEDADTLYKKGSILRRMGKKEEAVDVFNQVRAIDPDYFKNIQTDFPKIDFGF